MKENKPEWIMMNSQVEIFPKCIKCGKFTKIWQIRQSNYKYFFLEIILIRQCQFKMWHWHSISFLKGALSILTIVLDLWRSSGLYTDEKICSCAILAWMFCISGCILTMAVIWHWIAIIQIYKYKFRSYCISVCKFNPYLADLIY